MRGWMVVFLMLTIVLSTTAQSVVINEVMAGPAPNPMDFSSQNTANANSLYSVSTSMQPPYNREYIELFNTHPCDTADISCWTLGSNANSPVSGDNWGVFTFPHGTKIPPLGFLIVGGNNAQVPFNDFNITQYRQNTFSIQYLCGDPTRWFLRDAWGWIALYNPQGSPVDAIYWNDYQGNAQSLYQEAEYQNMIVNTMACGGTKIHAAASGIPGITYVGHILPGTFLSFQRIQDGKPTWHPSPVTPTPRAPNGIPIQPPTLSYSIHPDHCSNHDGEIAIQITAGGTGPYTIYWNGSFIPGSQLLSNLAAGTYTVKVQDAYDCLNVYDTITVLDEPGPDIHFAAVSDEKCSAADGSITVLVTGGTNPLNIIWNTTPPMTTPVISGLTAGLYIISITDANGCAASDSVVLTNHKEPQVAVNLLSPDSCGYYKGKAVATATGDYPPYYFVWNSNPTQTGAIAMNLPAGNYTVTATDSVCYVTGHINIPLIPAPLADFIASPPVVYIEDGWVHFTDLTPGPITAWLWDFGDGNTSATQHPDHHFSDLGTYTVKLTVTDPNECIDMVKKPVIVKDISSTFFPNAFSPNGDGINDRFMPTGINITHFNLHIYDRFGRVLATSSDPESGWDGKINGIDAPEGVYVWTAEFTFDYGDNILKDLKMKGTVTLIR